MPLALMVLSYGWHWTVLDLFAEALVITTFILITIIDFEERVVLSEVVLAGALVIILAGIRNSVSWFLPMLEGALVGIGIALSLWLFGHLLTYLLHWETDDEPLGFGDVMIAGVVGLATGWPGVLMAMFLAVLFGGIAGVGILMIHKIQRRPSMMATMAYGPYLALAALLLHFQGTFIASSLLK